MTSTGSLQPQPATKAPSDCDALARAMSMRLELVARLSQAQIEPDLPRFRSSTCAQVRLQEGGTCAASSAASGRGGHAVLDRWFTSGLTSVMLKVEEAGASGLHLGLVSSNFLPGAREWDAPLSESRHAIVAHTVTGKIHYKGAPSVLALPLPLDQAMQLRRQLLEQRQPQQPQQPQQQWQQQQQQQQRDAAGSQRQRDKIAGTQPPARCVVRSGSIVHLVVDLDRRELTVEVLSNATPSAEVLSSVVIEGLPVEVGVAVGFASGEEQRVRILAMKEEEARSRSTPPCKMLADLWDDDHRVAPLKQRGRRSRDLSDQLQLSVQIAHTARDC